jgi:hypothetical protein
MTDNTTAGHPMSVVFPAAIGFDLDTARRTAREG